MSFKEYIHENANFLDQKNTYYHFILKPFVGKRIGKWTFEYERMSGTFSFDKGDNSIYATPYYEGSNGVPVDFQDEDGDYKSLGLVKLPEITGDSKKDVGNYFKLITPYLMKMK